MSKTMGQQDSSTLERPDRPRKESSAARPFDSDDVRADGTETKDRYAQGSIGGSGWKVEDGDAERNAARFIGKER